MADTDPQHTPRKRGRGKRIGLWALASVVLMVFAGAVAGFLLIGRPVDMPEWVNQSVQKRIAKSLPGMEVQFDRITLFIADDWHPQFRLTDVELINAEQQSILSFSEVDATLSITALKDGLVAPKSIFLSGVFLNVRRESGGQVDVAFGEGRGEADRQRTGLGNLTRQIEQALLLPNLAKLQQVEIEAVTLRYDDLRADRGWTIDGGRMRLIREGQFLSMGADLALLGGRDYVSTLALSYQSELGTGTADFGVQFEDMDSGDIASQSPGLAWLDIVRAPISGALRANVQSDGTLGPLNATLQIGQGVLQPSETVRPIPFNSARSYFTYTAQTRTLQFDELSVDSVWLTARASGRAELTDLQNGLPQGLVAQLNITEFSGNPFGIYDETLSLEHVAADFSLNFAPFKLRLGQMLIQDQGQSLVVDGALSATKDDWNLALNGHMDALEPERLMGFWPLRAVPNTRNWIDSNVLKGRLYDINLAVRSKPGSRPDTYLDFKFSDASVRFLKFMPLIENGSGFATIEQSRLSVVAESGTVRSDMGGEIDVSGSSFVIPDILVKSPPAEVHLNVSSTVTAALALLDRPPFNFISKAKLPVDIADGLARAQGMIHVSLKKKLPVEEISLSITAQAENVSSTVLVPGKVLSSPMLEILATEKTLTIKGAGRVGQVPFDGEWSADLGPNANKVSVVQAEVELSERFVEEFNIGLTPDMYSGSAKAKLRIELEADTPPRFALSSKLEGIRLVFGPLGWTKPANTSGKLLVSGQLGTPVKVTQLALNATGLNAIGNILLNADGGLNRINLSELRVGRWLNAHGALIGRGGGRTPGVHIDGGSLDLRRAPQTQTASSGTGGGGPIIANFETVQISDGIALKNFAGKFSTAGGMNGKFNGLLNGGAQVSGVIVPKDGRSAFRIRSDDAGGVMRASGVLKNAHGGELDLSLVPVGEAGNYNGTLKASALRVRDAPAMAELLNAISVIGLLEQLGGQGISFSAVNASFKLTPDRLIVRQGSAEGPSMGLSMDGVYWLNSGKFDMQGVISPIYIVNAVGQVISRKGEGLFGFNYSLRGTASDPKVQVNPLSVLTPGFIRDIFRRPSPAKDEAFEEGEIPASNTPKKPTFTPSSR